MNFLLDTQVFLWLMEGHLRLSSAARECFKDNTNRFFLSSISVWEIMQKYALGKLPLPATPGKFIPEACERCGIESLHFSEAQAFHLQTLPNVHKDPFDRMLICQAIEHGLTIVTNDSAIQQYPVRTLW